MDVNKFKQACAEAGLSNDAIIFLVGHDDVIKNAPEDAFYQERLNDPEFKEYVELGAKIAKQQGLLYVN